MECPYNIILGRETALPSPLYDSGATGIDIIPTWLDRVLKHNELTLYDC